MSSSHPHGRPEEEMFLAQQKPRTQEIIPPLRIQKTASPGPNNNTTYTPPPASQASSHSRPPVAPLPYPDDGPRPFARTNTAPIDDRRPGNNQMPFGGADTASRPHFSANDPNRPTVAGYGHPPVRAGTSSPAQSVGSAAGRKPSDANPYPEFHQQYFAAPNSGSAGVNNKPTPSSLKPGSTGLSRLDSTASVMTTRATRGSPPPPETPIIPPPTDIEARFAAAGFGRPGAAATSASAAPSAASQQRTAQYAVPQPTQTTPVPIAAQNPATAAYHIPNDPRTASAYSNAAPVQSPPPGSSVTSVPPVKPQEHALEHDFNHLNVHDEPPPSYASIEPTGAPSPNRYPNEKGRPAAVPTPIAGAASVTAVAAQSVLSGGGPAATQAPNVNEHPAFQNDPRFQYGQSQNSSPASTVVAGPSSYPMKSGSPAPSQVPASPPPLPEGWMAHMDPNSGQYYYIHLPTQSTQWEFPKGPTPLNLNEPLSPTGTFVNPLTSPVTQTYGSKLPLASPGFPVPQSATVRPDGFFSMASIASPTAAGFTGPPPTAGVDVYNVQPSNGVYFGPYLRYTNMDIERGNWLGSILLSTNTGQPPTIHLHQSVDLSPNPQQLKAVPIYSHQRWIFYRYEIDIPMDDEGAKWTYAITSHLGCTRYEFLVAGRHETSWRFIAHSGNDFAMNVNANERNKLGGLGFMWKDILQKHIDCNGFHCQLGVGDQIFADRMWKEIPLLKEWTAISGKENRKNAQWTTKHEDDVTHAYFHYYTSHFDQPHLREAWAQIPHVLTLDHHDIFDGFGSYPDYMQQSNMFKNIGKIGIEMYLLFQHHTTHDLLRNVSNDVDLFTVTGQGWHFIKYLGPAVVVVGPDTRSERNGSQVMAGPTYQGLFPKIALLPPSVQHCIWMLPVPIVYPRLESMEHLASTVATGKKVATGTFNMLGKVTSSAAGIIGAKGVVGDGFNSVKKAVGKSGLMSGVLSPFGGIDIMDELRDQWTHESKDLERTYLIRTLQGIAHNKSLRMTFLSGSVSVCGAGMLHDPSQPQDHKTMYQLIASAVVNAPPNAYILRLLHNNKALYIPQNGHKSTHTPSDTKEDMMEIFGSDVGGQPREMKRLMNRRNYVACVAFDPEIVQGAFGATSPGKGGGRLSLAVDFMVQGDGGYNGAVKYGPVIVPSLEYGR